jgi:hypothetical protein
MPIEDHLLRYVLVDHLQITDKGREHLRQLEVSG